MHDLRVTIHLASDAEPGSGLGSVGLDQILPRSHDGRPILPASHVKGLMLDALRSICAQRGWEERLAHAVFGAGDDAPSRVTLTDARVDGRPKTLTIMRTSVDASGSKQSGTLRSVEALAADTKLTATMSVDASSGSAVDLAARLAALSVFAVGGSRNRGAGACRLTLDSESRRPGELLRALSTMLEADGYPALLELPPALAASPLDQDAPAVWRKVVLVAESPICCPERPVAPGNTIVSGFGIPASAVQGAILTRLNAEDSALASACFEDSRFRAWPLLPVAMEDELAGSELEQAPLGMYVAMTYRISKLPRRDDGSYVLGDEALGVLPENEPSPGAPLLGCSGVTTFRPGEEPRLWRAGSIPRTLRTHGVHRDGEGRRNLFTVVSMAPMVFTGLIALPEEAAAALDRLLAEDARISIGKARSIRGHARLRLIPFDEAELGARQLPDDLTGRVFVVQSPLAIPDDWQRASAEALLAQLVERAGWPSVDLTRSRARCGLRYGWNRHRRGADRRYVGKHKRLRARRCILPGSTVVLGSSHANIAKALLTGVGDGRQEGLGALLPHPGVAAKVDRDRAEATPRASADSSRLAFELWTEAHGCHGPSASQIGTLAGLVQVGGNGAALEHLQRQRLERPDRVWQRWQSVHDALSEALREKPPATTYAALRGWRNLAAAAKEARR